MDCRLRRLRPPGRALRGERPDGNPAAAPRSLRGGTWGAAALPSPAGSGARRLPKRSLQRPLLLTQGLGPIVIERLLSLQSSALPWLMG